MTLRMNAGMVSKFVTYYLVSLLHHHLQGAGAHCGGPTTGRTACFCCQEYLLRV